MADKKVIDAMWDDSPIDVSAEVNFIWSIANKLRGTYQSDKYTPNGGISIIGCIPVRKSWSRKTVRGLRWHYPAWVNWLNAI